MKNTAKTLLITKIGIISARNTGTMMQKTTSADTMFQKKWFSADNVIISF